MSVSVIIPTYNRAILVTEAIQSVRRQSYKDIEIIVVDDGSTDATEQAVKSCGGNIKFIKQSHLGPNTARNRALKEATGGYIALLDDDDLWLDFKLELQVSVLDAFPEIAYTFSDFHILKEAGDMIGAGLSTWHNNKRRPGDIYGKRIRASALSLPGRLTKKDFDIYVGELYSELLFQPYVLPSSALIRKECITPEIRFVDEDFHCGDWEFFARLSRIHRSAFIDLETTINRSHNDPVRLTRKSQKVQNLCRLNMIRRVWKSDRDFYRDHSAQVDRVEGDQLIKMAKLHILASEPREAVESLKRRDALDISGDKAKIFLLRMLTRIPMAGKLLSLILNAKSTLAGLTAGLSFAPDKQNKVS